MAKAKVEKTFKLVAKVKGCPEVFMEGKEPGVVASQTLTFNETEETYRSPRFLMHLSDRQDEFYKEFFEVVLSEEDGEQE